MCIRDSPRTALDTYLPKLIRAGARVAICDRLELVEKVRKNEEPTLSNNTDMAKKSKEKAVQEDVYKRQTYDLTREGTIAVDSDDAIAIGIVVRSR